MNTDTNPPDATEQPSCAACLGKGTILDVHMWSDGRGHVHATCNRCKGSGIEPRIEDLRKQLDEAWGLIHDLRHVVLIAVRGVCVQATEGIGAAGYDLNELGAARVGGDLGSAVKSAARLLQPRDIELLSYQTCFSMDWCSNPWFPNALASEPRGPFGRHGNSTKTPQIVLRTFEAHKIQSLQQICCRLTCYQKPYLTKVVEQMVADGTLDELDDPATGETLYREASQ